MERRRAREREGGGTREGERGREKEGERDSACGLFHLNGKLLMS